MRIPYFKSLLYAHDAAPQLPSRLSHGRCGSYSAQPERQKQSMH